VVRRLLVAATLIIAIAWLAVALTAPPEHSPTSRRSSAIPAHTFHARPSTLAGAFAQANPGDRIVLASGEYGTFRGGMKTGRVVIAAAPGARVEMAVEFNPAANITLAGVRLTGLEIADRRSHDITIRDSRFEHSQAIIRTGDLADANVELAHNVHDGFVKCDGCYEGRIDLVGRNRHDSGVTIRDSVFSGGNSDGIQNGGNGVRILHNTFVGILQHDGAEGVHADAIQLYGSARTIIRGNQMHDVATGIMAPDGTDHEVIEDNSIETAGYPFAITLGGDRGSIVRGNRLAGGACHYGLACGTLRISAGKDGVGGSGTIVEGNLLGALAVDAASRLATQRGNSIGG
jgi:parallel beta helix pectate lyase-like protein